MSDDFWAIIWLSDVDIGYPIELNRWTASDKLYITQLLPTRYSINITNTFGGYQYNKQWMYVYEDFQLNIHLVYKWVRRIADRIFIQCMQDSAGLLTGYSFSVWHRSGGLLTEYSFSVCRDPADYWQNIHSVYEWVRRIANWIFSWCMQGSGGLPTTYSFGVCRGQVDYWLDIHSVYGIGQADFWPNIHLVYAGIWQITDQILIWCMQGSGGLPIGYSLIGLGGSELNI